MKLLILILFSLLLTAYIFNVKLKRNLFKNEPLELDDEIFQTFPYNDYFQTLPINDTEYLTFIDLDLHRDKSDNVILYLHGRDENLKRYKKMLEWFHYCEQTIVMLDYRGYGLSSSYPTVGNMYRDSLHIADYITNKYPEKRIIIWGESMGSIPSIYLASRIPCYKLFLFGPISSLSDIVKYKMDNANLFYDWVDPISLMLMNINNKEIIKKIECDVMLMHSTEDEIIPYKSSLLLKHAAQSSNSIELVKIKGLHAKPIISKDSFRRFAEFLEINYKDLDTAFTYLYKFIYDF